MNKILSKYYFERQEQRINSKVNRQPFGETYLS